MSIFPGLFGADDPTRTRALPATMIVPNGIAGAAFGAAETGDVRNGDVSWLPFVDLGAPSSFAFPRQVHGASVVEAERPGLVGDADAIITRDRSIAVGVATADCVPILISGDGFAAAVHAGWRGVAANVVGATLTTLSAMGLRPSHAVIGPAIGPCCYEVGDEVIEAVGGFAATTSWGTNSVDLPGAVADQLGDIDTVVIERCTMTDPSLFSFRRDQTAGRQVAAAWIP